MGGGGGGLGKSTPKVPKSPTPEPVPTYEESAEPVSAAARNEEARKLRQKRGMAGTVLTSPLGTTGGSGNNLLGM